MNYKNIILVIVIIAVVAGGGIAFYLYRNNILSVAQKAKQTTEIKIEDKKITDNTKPFKISIIYPYIEGLDDFNSSVKILIDNELDNFKTNSLANDEAVKKTDPQSYEKYPREYELNIDYTAGEISENIASIILNVYKFEGGAHGASYFLPENYDIKNKKGIKLSSLFHGQNDYMQKISDYCMPQLRRQISERMQDGGEWVSQNESWIRQGSEAAEENYSVFLINKDKITFYFPEYQVAPYTAGSFKVDYPR